MLGLAHVVLVGAAGELLEQRVGAAAALVAASVRQQRHDASDGVLRSLSACASGTGQGKRHVI